MRAKAAAATTAILDIGGTLPSAPESRRSGAPRNDRGPPAGGPRPIIGVRRSGLFGRLDRRRVQRAGVVDGLGVVALLAPADAHRGRLGRGLDDRERDLLLRALRRR